jgi:hypothetical protein
MLSKGKRGQFGEISDGELEALEAAVREAMGGGRVELNHNINFAQL